jgi:hypothetical protein
MWKNYTCWAYPETPLNAMPEPQNTLQALKVKALLGLLLGKCPLIRYSNGKLRIGEVPTFKFFGKTFFY